MRMLKCDDRSGGEATQCYEMLKLLQAAFPPGPDCDGWCPRTASDYELLMECLAAKDTGSANLNEETPSLGRKRKVETFSVVSASFFFLPFSSCASLHSHHTISSLDRPTST